MRAKPLLILVAGLALVGAFISFLVIAGRHRAPPRQVGNRWYADDAPETLQPNGNDPGQRVDLSDSDRFWKRMEAFVGRRVVLIGRIQAIDAESSRSLSLVAISGVGSIACYWSAPEDVSFAALQPKQIIRLSGICRIHWNPRPSKAGQASAALEACRIEP